MHSQGQTRMQFRVFTESNLAGKNTKQQLRQSQTGKVQSEPRQLGPENKQNVKKQGSNHC